MLSQNTKPGDVVVYRKTKFGNRPGPRAKSIHPTASGDGYTYHVDKYWVVAAVEDNGKVLLKTRTGKEHVFNMHDPMLRRVTWWERWLRRDQMPTLAQAQAAGVQRLLNDAQRAGGVEPATARSA
jgi:hypothetical protein